MPASPDLRAALAATGLSQVALARVLGVDPSTLRRWLSGARAMPEPVRRLCALLARDPTLARRLRALVAVG